MVTQVEIAKRVGLDVSSVNKILCGTPGPKFRESTIRIVTQTAKKMGYNFNRQTKHSLRADNKRLRDALLDLFDCRVAAAANLPRDPKPETNQLCADLIAADAKAQRKTG